MQHPQMIVFEGDDWLSRQLQGLADQKKWTLRQARRVPACLDLLRKGRPTVLILNVGRDLIVEFELLERVCRLFPHAAVVVVLERDDPPLAGLAWDLGARFVLILPHDRDRLGEVVAGLMISNDRKE